MFQLTIKKKYPVIVFFSALSVILVIQFAWSNQLPIVLIGSVFFIIAILLILIFGVKRFFIYSICYSFILGWRGIDLTNGIKIFPMEIFLWFGCIYIGIEYISKNMRINLPVNIYSIGLLINSFIGVFTGLFNNHNVYYVILELKTFLVFVPCLFITNNWIRKKEDVKWILKHFVIACSITSLLGIIEYIFPDIFKYINIEETIYIRNNFAAGGLVHLAGFSFWGGAIISVILVPAFGICLYYVTEKGKFNFWFWIGSISLLFGILLSGYRSAWIGLIVVSIGLVLFRESKTIWLVVAVGGFFLVNVEFYNRLSSIFLMEASGDPTTIRRIDATYNSLSSILESPLGTGWASSYPFNDWVYIASTIGIVGFLIFIGWYLTLLRKLLKITPISISDGRFAKHILISLLGYAFCMIGGVMGQVPPIMIFFWFLFTISWRYTEISSFADMLRK